MGTALGVGLKDPKIRAYRAIGFVRMNIRIVAGQIKHGQDLGYHPLTSHQPMVLFCLDIVRETRKSFEAYMQAQVTATRK